MYHVQASCVGSRVLSLAVHLSGHLFERSDIFLFSATASPTLPRKTQTAGSRYFATSAIMADTATSNDADAAAQRAAEQARLRKERREAKIKAGGSARLERITGVGGRVVGGSYTAWLFFFI